MTDALTILDPRQNTRAQRIVKITPGAAEHGLGVQRVADAVAHLGTEMSGSGAADPRSVAIDGQARVWLAVRSREVAETAGVLR